MSEENYPVVEIRLDFLDYRWVAPHFPRQKQCRVVTMYEECRENLVDPSRPSNSRGMKVQKVYDSMVKVGMVNPLIVIKDKEKEDLYYVIVGNQRLAALRAMRERDPDAFSKWFPEGKVKCRVGNYNDLWTDKTEAKRKHPYEKVEGIDTR